MPQDDALPADTVWSRIKPLLPYILTAALFAAGTYALYRLLAPVNFRDVMQQVRGTPRHIILLAILSTAGGYIALIGYDWSALRYIGKKLPLPVVFTGGFLGYAFGNTIGAGPVTGGAVRYRIYSALGLSGYDIAAIAAFGSLAFGFGTTILGFGALAYHPYALHSTVSLSPQVLRWLSVCILVVTVGILAFFALRRSEVTIRGFRLVSPSPGIMAGQLGFTAVDLLLAATTLYLLLPPNDLGFATFLAVFAAGVMAGVLSHVPGGVGVFETVIIAALPASVPVDQAAAGLLLYRLIYYLLPFGLALVMLSLSEMRMVGSKAGDKPAGKGAGAQIGSAAPVFRAVSAIVPMAMSALIFASGLFMLLSSLIPPTSDFAEEMELLLPLGFVEGGALLSSAIGAALVIIAHGLLRRVSGAWWLSVGALGGGIVASLLNGVDYERAVILALALLILLPTRKEFFRTTRLTRNVLSVKWVLIVAGVAILSLAVLFFANKATPYANELWWQFATDKSAPRAMRAGLVGSLVLGLVLLIFALRPGSFRSERASDEDLRRAAAIIAAQPDPEANIALTGDKSLLFSESGRSFLMYRVQGRTWVALHEPVGDPDEAAALVWEFNDAAHSANARPVFYSVSAESVPLWIDMGLAVHKMGEEAVVPLAAFGLEGSARKRLRTAHNRAIRDGLEFSILEAPIDDALMGRLREISDDWLDDKNTAEKGFSVGAFDPVYFSNFPIAVVRHQGRIVAFANLWRTDRKGKATIDLMRYVRDAPPGLMDYLFTELMLWFKAQGYSEFSLGNAPLAGLEARRGARISTRLGAYIYHHGGPFYNFEGLRNFKEKFDPEWRSIYVAMPMQANIIAVTADIIALISGGLRQTVVKTP
ncbi:bifunctional lysylphosphatidylglycerol flippase/synthetase MprF [Brevirhabdus sp.]|uniref:bifunctional lysylphosphatidylglycerol flippase/synthetase MprF n=1 Tax=Brevirhabdus sp. TaxID=2004514 RepID=UPI00405816BB